MNRICSPWATLRRSAYPKSISSLPRLLGPPVSQIVYVRHLGGGGPAHMRVQLANSPDSWGVWFPSEPRQIPWQRYLDEVAQAGYTGTELGPYGYLPTSSAQLRA